MVMVVTFKCRLSVKRLPEFQGGNWTLNFGIVLKM